MRKATIALITLAMTLLFAGTALAASHVLFPDVEADSPHAGNILWAWDNDIFKGYEDGNFGPKDYVKRDQAASMLKRYHDAFEPRDGEDGEDGLLADYEIVVSSELNFSAGGWTGWSCDEGQMLINGSVSGVSAEQSISVIGPATYPHHTYPEGEHGLAVRSAESGTGTITLICADVN